ncbi:Uncharacterised protein [Mycobacteroides abscessus subsp. abscessus]|nr:Uncharacterised protein [Mycobacteroides abscessus subsp. abscessus]
MVSLSFLSSWINAHLLAVTAYTLELDNSVHFREKSIVASASNVHSRVDLCTALTVKDRTAGYELTVCTLSAKALRD